MTLYEINHSGRFGDALCVRLMTGFFSTYRSERVGKTNVGGTLLTEAKYINLSLHYLEQVNTMPCTLLHEIMKLHVATL